MVNATLRYGTTGASAHGYAELALILGPLFHHYHNGTRFGKLACHLVDKSGSEGFKAKVFFCAQKAMLWTEPIHSAIALVRHGIEVGVATHDLPYASFISRQRRRPNKQRRCFGLLKTPKKPLRITLISR